MQECSLMRVQQSAEQSEEDKQAEEDGAQPVPN